MPRTRLVVVDDPLKMCASVPVRAPLFAIAGACRRANRQPAQTKTGGSTDLRRDGRRRGLAQQDVLVEEHHGDRLVCDASVGHRGGVGCHADCSLRRQRAHVYTSFGRFREGDGGWQGGRLISLWWDRGVCPSPAGSPNPIHPSLCLWYVQYPPQYQGTKARREWVSTCD